MKRPPARGVGLRAVGIGALCVAVCFTCPAAADPGWLRQVEVRVGPCNDPPFETARFVELLRVELRALGVDARSSGPGEEGAGRAGSPSIALTLPSCQRFAHEVELRFLDSASSKALERRMQLSDIAFDARARALAIAAAELYRAATTEVPASFPVTAPPAPPEALPTEAAGPPPSPPRVSQTPPPSAPSRPRAPHAVHRPAPAPAGPVTLEAAFVGRDYPTERSALLGGDLAASVPLAGILRARGGVMFALGEATLPFNDANPVTSNVALGLVLGHLELVLRSQGTPFIELGPRVNLGYGWVERRLGNPRIRVASGISDLGVKAGIGAPMSQRWLGFLMLDIGHTLGATAIEAAAGTPGATSVGLAGILFEVGVGVGFRP